VRLAVVQGPRRPRRSPGARGSVIAAAGSGDEVLCADLDTALVDAVRGGDGGGHTYFADRRPELYGAISRPAE